MGVTIAVTRVACNTATGDQTITTTDLDGLTPKGAMFICTKAVADDTAVAHAALSIGLTDGTNQQVISVFDEDALGATDSYRRGATDEVVMIMLGDGTIDGEANFKNWETNGVTITWGDAASAAWLLTVIFFAGTDLSCDCGVTVGKRPDGTATQVTSLSYEPDVILFVGHGTSFDDTASVEPPVNLGIATNEATIVQGAVSHVTLVAAPTSANVSYTSHSRVQVNMWAAGSNVSRALELTDFLANGFEVTMRVGSGDYDLTFGWMALHFNGAVGFWSDQMASPTSTGDWAQTGPGFTPQFVMMLLGPAPTLDTVYNSGEAGCVAISAMDADEEYCNSISAEDAQATTDTQSLVDSDAVNFPDGGGAAFFAGTGPAGAGSFDANGFTINFGAVNGTARQWYALAIEGAAAAARRIFITHA